MLRNAEIKLITAVMLILTGLGTAAGFAFGLSPGLITLACALALDIAFFLFTRWRYREIQALCGHLSAVCAGKQVPDFRDMTEGELSILKDDIYKVVRMLQEKSGQYREDREALADALSDISHQLRTPLTSMNVMTDLLNQNDLPPEKRAEFAANLRTQLTRIEWLVTSLLKLSKIDAGTIVFKKETFPVRDLVARAAAPLLIPMELKEQELEVHGDADAPLIADLNWTAEALTNILKNCVEHTQTGGRLWIDVAANPLYVEVRIQDNGPGISREDLPHIFKRFYRGKNASPDSVGIGLAMAYAIVSGQNGDITVRSREGSGTAFSVKFFKQSVL